MSQTCLTCLQPIQIVGYESYNGNTYCELCLKRVNLFPVTPLTPQQKSEMILQYHESKTNFFNPTDTKYILEEIDPTDTYLQRNMWSLR